MKISEARYKANQKWNKNNYDRIEIIVPKGRKQIIKDIAEASEKSLNGYINEAIDEKIEREKEST